MQLIIREFLGGRIGNKIEKEKRLSNFDCGYRKGYSIETVFLEKRLIFNHTKKTEDVSARATSDLEASHDRKTPELCSLEE